VPRDESPNAPATPAPASEASKRPARPAPTLDGAQRRYLRSLAHPLKPVVFVGESGLTEAVVKAVDAALGAHELIKIRLRQPADKHATADELAAATHAALCGVLGHTVVLYRPDLEEPRIQLPRRH
jgi:RNA-binding protein